MRCAESRKGQRCFGRKDREHLVGTPQLLAHKDGGHPDAGRGVPALRLSKDVGSRQPGNGLRDGIEDADHNGEVSPGETDPRLADTDGGSVNDGEEVARGEALGVISHGQGTAQALTEGELTGASASVATSTLLGPA